MPKHLRAQRTSTTVFCRMEIERPWWEIGLTCLATAGVFIFAVWGLYAIYTALGGK